MPSAVVQQLALMILPTSYNVRCSLFGYESLGTFYTDTDSGSVSDTPTVNLWKCGTLTPCRLVYGGKESDSDDDDILPEFQIPPPYYSMSELQHMNQYAELKPAYDFLRSGDLGFRIRHSVASACLSTLHPDAPHPILYTMVTLASGTSLQVLFDTCSSLDLIDEDVAIRCGFTLCPSDKMAFRVAGGKTSSFS